MNLLAIDPGTEESAYVVFRDGEIATFGKVQNEIVLGIATGFGGAMVYEMIASYGMPVGREVFETVMWIGRFVQAYGVGRDSQRVYRRDVKLHLCKSPKANDASIRQALIDRFGPTKEKAIGTKKKPGPLYGMKADTWAALAVGVTWMDTKGQVGG